MFDRSLLFLGEEEDEEEFDDWDEDDWGDIEERYYQAEIDDGESAGEHLARVAADIERGLAEVPPGWKLDRPSPEILVWTAPSGRRYASTLAGAEVPLP
ncbi:MAG: hypothetical protein ABSB76_09485 [Streptosporangiaceae bacterium]|jgi:hypothetical protein